jgi:hypothetical protein
MCSTNIFENLEIEDDFEIEESIEKCETYDVHYQNKRIETIEQQKEYISNTFKKHKEIIIASSLMAGCENTDLMFKKVLKVLNVK